MSAHWRGRQSRDPTYYSAPTGTAEWQTWPTCDPAWAFSDKVLPPVSLALLKWQCPALSLGLSKSAARASDYDPSSTAAESGSRHCPGERPGDDGLALLGSGP